MKRTIIVAGLASLLLLTGCGGSSSPTGTAASLLNKTGATGSTSPYTVTPEATNAPDTQCPVGAAEADGMIGQNEVSVCVFSSEPELQGFIAAGDQYGASDALILVGQDALILVIPPGVGTPPPPSRGVVQSVTSKTGGQNVTQEEP